MGKVYLSLDDLHKLYGLSPAVVSEIKKKRKKRRNKKNKKIQNGTMGNKPSDSSHMEGYSSALAVAAKQLQQTNINKHIQEINDKNEVIQKQSPLQIDNKTPLKKEQFKSKNIVVSGLSIDPEKLIADIGAGHVTAVQKGNSLTFKDTRLNAKPGPQLGSKRFDTNKPYMTPTKKSSIVNKKDNTGITTATTLEPAGAAASGTFTFPQSYTGLANNYSRNMDPRDDNYVLGDILNDGFVGALNIGTGDEKFVSEIPPVIDTAAATIEVNENIAVAAEKAKQDIADEEQAKQDAQDAQDEQDALDAEFEAEQLKQQQAQDAIDAQVEKDIKDAKDAKEAQVAKDKRIKELYDFYTVAQLDIVRKQNKLSYPKDVKNKEQKYNYLRNLHLLVEE